MVAEQGSFDQLKACGLATVGDQMKLRKLIKSKGSAALISSCKKDISTTSFPGHKLTKVELNELSPEDRRVYIMK